MHASQWALQAAFKYGADDVAVPVVWRGTNLATFYSPGQRLDFRSCAGFQPPVVGARGEIVIAGG
jgi:hypothetical protein